MGDVHVDQADKRYITVYKASKKPTADGDDDGESLPVLTLAKEAADVLGAHVARYRISDDERELLSAGGSSEAAHRVHGEGDARRSLKKSTSKEVVSQAPRLLMRLDSLRHCDHHVSQTCVLGRAVCVTACMVSWMR